MNISGPLTLPSLVRNRLNWATDGFRPPALQSRGSEGRHLVRCSAQYKCAGFLTARYRGSCGFESCLDGVMRELHGEARNDRKLYQRLGSSYGAFWNFLAWEPSLFQVALDKQLLNTTEPVLVYPGCFHLIARILEVWWDLGWLTPGAWFYLPRSWAHWED